MALMKRFSLFCKNNLFCVSSRNVFLLICTLTLLIISACSFSSEKLSEYFTRNSTGIVIRTVSYERAYPCDGDGFISVPSAAPCTLTFYLTNPQGIDFTASASLDSATSVSVLSAAGITADDEIKTEVIDKEHISVTYSRSLL